MTLAACFSVCKEWSRISDNAGSLVVAIGYDVILCSAIFANGVRE